MEAALGLYAALFAGPWAAPVSWAPAHGWIALAALLAFLAPNTSQWFARFEPGVLPAHHALDAPRWAWSPRPGAALALAVLAAATLLALSRETVFLYFQF
jgi:hypothetical protein